MALPEPWASKKDLAPIDAAHAWDSIVTGRVRSSLKELLETKHLYQNVTVEDPLLELQGKIIDKLEQFHFSSGVSERRRANWTLIDPAELRQTEPETARWLVRFRPPDVKLFCERCDRTEAFNLLSAESFLDRGGSAMEHRHSTTIQVFALSFLCQSCKFVPEVLLIRRVGLKLTLCGRAPMEVANVPTVIPKTVRRFYSGAIVAHQSGQTLAGNFMLRALIEQWARSQVQEPSGEEDTLVDGYMATLPDDFKGRFYSMRELYSDLSEDIHAATGSAELFDRAAGEITKHFEARRLFGLPDKPQADAPTEAEVSAGRAKKERRS